MKLLFEVVKHEKMAVGSDRVIVRLMYRPGVYQDSQYISAVMPLAEALRDWPMMSTHEMGPEDTAPEESPCDVIAATLSRDPLDEGMVPLIPVNIAPEVHE